MLYPASNTPISTAAAHLRSSKKERTSPRLHRVSFSQCCRPGMASQIAFGKHYADTQALKLDVATMFRQQGRGFCAGKGGGGRQKKYVCNAFKEGCKAEVPMRRYCGYPRGSRGANRLQVLSRICTSKVKSSPALELQPEHFTANYS